MKGCETIAGFFLRLMLQTNITKSCDEHVIKLLNVEKVSRALTIKFNHIIMTIKESKNLSEMKIEELQASLETHEMRLK